MSVLVSWMRLAAEARPSLAWERGASYAGGNVLWLPLKSSLGTAVGDQELHPGARGRVGLRDL